MPVSASRWRDSALLVAWCGVIFFLSSRSSVPMPHLFPDIDKLVHGTAYALMGWLAWQAFRHGVARPGLLWLLAAGFCSLYGVSDEWHQSFVPGRTPDVMDWLADTVGGAIGAFVAARILERRSGDT